MNLKHTPGYEVTSDGRVLSVASNWRGHSRREMCQSPNSDGYPSVRIIIDGRRIRLAVHRLVAANYLPDRPSPMSHEKGVAKRMEELKGFLRKRKTSREEAFADYYMGDGDGWPSDKRQTDWWYDGKVKDIENIATTCRLILRAGDSSDGLVTLSDYEISILDI